MKQVRTRFAPSPTGYLHIGGVRTALFCWLFARQKNGQYILRVEDTDRERSTQEATDAIVNGMKWLKLNADEGPYFQSQRLDRYREVARQLLEKRQAYYCHCSRQELEAVRLEQQRRGEKPRYDRCCRDAQRPKHSDVEPVLRFKTPIKGGVVFNDLVHGTIRVSNAELDDLIILRSDGTPTYNFTVVVDDVDMQISHVIRGDDHINNTPKQIHIFNALGAELPEFAHLPMINGPDGRKLSKRHGAVSVLEYREEGFLPQALLNYLARLGWSHGDQELFTMDEMVRHFDLSDVNKSAASFDRDKLLWTNQHHIKQAPAEELSAYLVEQLARLNVNPQNGPSADDVVEVYREKARTMKEMAEQVSYLYADEIDYDAQSAQKFLNAESLEILKQVHQQFTQLDQWRVDSIGTVVKSIVTQSGLKFPKVAQPLRVAVTGNTNSPSIDQTLWLPGKDRCLRRIEKAIDYIHSAMAKNQD